MLGPTNYEKILLMCTYFHQTTDMTMTEALQKKQNNIQLYTKTIHISKGGIV